MTTEPAIKPYAPRVRYHEVIADSAFKVFDFRWRVPRKPGSASPALKNPSPTLARQRREKFVSSVGAKEYADLLTRELGRKYCKEGV